MVLTFEFVQPHSSPGRRIPSDQMIRSRVVPGGQATSLKDGALREARCGCSVAHTEAKVSSQPASKCLS